MLFIVSYHTNPKLGICQVYIFIYNLNSTALLINYNIFKQYGSGFQILKKLFLFPPNILSLLQAIVFLLALIVRATNMPADYDSDDEYFPPRPSFQHPLIERQYPAVTGAPVASNIEQRPIRNDAWSTRMREKVCSIFLNDSKSIS